MAVATRCEPLKQEFPLPINDEDMRRSEVAASFQDVSTEDRPDLFVPVVYRIDQRLSLG